MSNKQIYRQCKLVKENTYDIAWIPSQFAKVGKNLSLKINEEWQEGWKVVEVYSGSRTHDEMDLQRDAQKRWESVIK